MSTPPSASALIGSHERDGQYTKFSNTLHLSPPRALLSNGKMCLNQVFFFFKERRSFLPSTVCPSSNISNCQRFSISRKSKIKIRYPPQTESHTFFCLNTAQIHKPSALTEPQSHLKSSITRLQLNKHFLFFFYIDVVLSARQRGGEGRQKKKTLKDFERLSFV